ncbi:MAG: NifB/NifX family molybdenum-iron cluster-binding protein [Opitutales bacterium]|jgi:predicted Fe-Mo cluster-binding NifX family protein
MTTTLIISIPILENKGLQSRISPHFGKAPMHMLVDSGGKIVAVIDQSANKPGMGSMPLAAMLDLGAKQVICVTIGRDAYKHLQDKEMDVKVTDANTVGEALAAYRAGTLEPVTDELLDMHHSHGQGLGHGAGKPQDLPRQGR